MKTIHLAIIILIVMIAFIISHQVFALDMGGPVEIAHYQLSQILAIGNAIYITYQENTNFGNVFFRESTDGGKTFGNIIQLNGKGGFVSEPYMAVSGNNVYVAWDYSSQTNNSKHVFFKRSSDSGNSFGKARILDSGPQSGNDFVEHVEANGPYVYVLMRYGNTTGNWNLLLKESHDYGKTFGKTLVLNDDNGSWLTSKIATAGTNVYVSSEDYRCSPNCRQSDIVLRQSMDNGATFGDIINLSKGNDISNNHQIAASGNNVYVAWQEGLPDIFFAKSTDGGATFSNKINLSKDIGKSETVRLAAQGNSVYVVFDHYNYPNHNSSYPAGVYLTKSSDGGSTFTEPKLIFGSERPGIFGFATGGDSIFFLSGKMDIFGNPLTFLEKSSDGGKTFTTSVVNKGLRWTAGFGKGLLVDGNHVYATFITAMPEDFLYISASSDGGKTFGNAVSINQDVTSTYREPLFSICCAVDEPSWFQNGWLWIGVGISAVIGSWFFIFRRFREK